MKRTAALASMNDTDRMEAQTTELILRDHILLYFSASEAERAAASAEMEATERSGDRIFTSGGTIPGGQWNPKWPTPARKAILALWRTTRET